MVAAVAAASLAVSACGGTAARSKRAPILNSQKVERAIERSAMDQPGVKAVVSCPKGVRQKQGATFSCTAIVGRSSTEFVVTQLDGTGDVHYVAR